MKKLIGKRSISICIMVTMLLAIVQFFPVKVYAAGLISSGKPVTASSSEMGSSPSLVIDADESNNSYWASDMGPNNKTWWQEDLQGVYHLTQVKLRNYVDGSRYYHYYVRGSIDGVNWTPIAVKSNNIKATDLGDTFNVNAVARYIRVYVTYNSANHSAHISDFKAYGYAVSMPATPPLEVNAFSLDKGAYATGNSVRLSYILHSPKQNVSIVGVKARIYGLTNPEYLSEVTLNGKVMLAPGGTIQRNDVNIWNIPINASPGAYGVYLQYTLSNGIVWESYQTFFRITTASQLTTYTIGKQSYKGLDIFTLNGGMSAEFAVEKAGEALAQGVSHSWMIQQGTGQQGPNPVYSTPQFLDKSVQRTVDFYNNNFGSTVTHDTVIFSTGVASVPYLSRAMKAPVLPLQFLASVDTVKEVQTILAEAAKSGNSAYSTLGYDGSMPTGVAWIKMLSIPQQYIDFLKNHKVKNVVIMGSNGTTGGETTAKKVLHPGTLPTGSQPEDIFVIYTNNGTQSDISSLTRRIEDISEAPLENTYRHVSDWESGVIQSQIDNFSNVIKMRTNVTAIDFVTGKTYLNLYDLATYISLEFLKKNQTALAPDGDPVRGIVLNPYLVSHPFYESKIHYVPLLFWQGDSMSSTVDNRVNVMVRNAVKSYFPQTNFNKLDFWINLSDNFGAYAGTPIQKELIANGLTNITKNDYSKLEVWNPSDGMFSISERVANNMTTYSTAAEIKKWDDKLMPISMKDLESIPNKYPDVSVTRQ